jgi:type I restriction enzyme M protein
LRSLVSTLGSFVWSIADQLRGPYRPNQYGSVILPFTILRRLDCILEPDRETVRDLAAAYENPNRLRTEVKKKTGRPFYNTSKYSFANL